MILTKIKIQNFRSIRDVELTFDPRCRVLIGINESGKTNILKAIALFDDDRPILPDDIRENSHEESTDQPAFVYFSFSLEKHEQIECLESVAHLLASDKTDRDIVVLGDRTFTLAQYVEYRSKIMVITY